jgi:hypothetical protein|tara:strand:+ start:68 stop:259 length:192 start_codon:yes stop_codon:yes gene_type:complete
MNESRFGKVVSGYKSYSTRLFPYCGVNLSDESEKGENNKLCACVSRVANGSITIDTPYRGHPE